MPSGTPGNRRNRAPRAWAQSDRDINCVFPLERLREMAADGTIKGLNSEFFGMMGFTLRLKKVIDETGPQIARKIERSQTDLVLLSGG